jgi:hypothetical protein
VLNVVALTNGEYLISSVALGVEEYYLGLGEAPGTWDGGWGARLGVSGEVQADELRPLIGGRHPVTGDELMTQLRPRRVKAFDLSFSAPLRRMRPKCGYAERLIMPSRATRSLWDGSFGLRRSA